MTQIQLTPDERQAHERAEKQRKIRDDIAAYVVVNAFLVGVWALTGFGYFWPAWVMGGWGVLLALGTWDAFWRHEPPRPHALR